MKNYYILDGQQESGPFTFDAIKSRGISSNSFIRLQNSSYWIAAIEIEDLADYIILSADGYDQRPLLPHGIPSKKRAMASALKIAAPVFICLVVGSMTIAMGIFLKTQLSKNEGNAMREKIGRARVEANILNAQQKTDKLIATDAAADLANELAKAEFYRNNWSKYMTLTRTKYRHRPLGGIKGLSITFTNNTDYPVDAVLVEIRYIKGNGRIWKIKTLPMGGIAPHSEKEQKVDNVNRSRSVRLRIKEIKSSRLNLRYGTEEIKTKVP